METDGDILSAAWLRPLLELVQQENFVEAEVLAEYFPNSPGRQLVQCAALIGQQKQLGKAEGLARMLFATNSRQEIASALVAVFGKSSIDLLSLAKHMIPRDCFFLAYFCLEAHLLLHPESAHEVMQSLLDLIVWDEGSARRMFPHFAYVQTEFPEAEYEELVGVCLRRLIELDSTPLQLSHYVLSLTAEYRPGRESSYLEKAETFLRVLAATGPTREYVESLLLVGRTVKKLEMYVRRLINLELQPDLALAVAQELVESKTSEYDLVLPFLAQALQHASLHREACIALYIQLGELAREREQQEWYEENFLKALNLSRDLQEFLAFKTPFAKLFFFFDNITLISQAKWYGQAKVDDLLSELSQLSPDQLRQDLFALLDKLPQYIKNPLALPWLASTLQSIFSYLLELTQDDAKRLKERSATLPASLRTAVRKGLSRQTIIETPELQPRGHWEPPQPRGHQELPQRPPTERWSWKSQLPQPQLPAPGQLERLPASPSPGQWVSRGDDERPGGVSIEQIEPLEQLEQRMQQVERHTRVDFPATCVLEQRVELKLQLTRSVPLATRVLEKILVAVGAEEKEITLDVQLTAANFALRQSHQKLVLPLDGDSEELTFTLVPLETGNQVVEIEFFHGSSRVGYVLVTTNVRKGISFAPASLNVFPLEDPLAGLENASSPPHARRTLHVSWLEHEGKLSYTIYSEDADEFGEWEQHGPDTKEQITEYLREFNALLTEAVVQGKPADEAWESTLLNLQSVCRHLFASLVPSQIAQSMQDWEPGSAVIISTNEQWIPWEILYDGRSFWGERFIVARHPRLSNRRSLPFTHRVNGGGSRTIHKIINVIGGEIPANEAQRAAMLFSQFPPERVMLLKEAPVAALQKVLPGADILHCTCHGYLEPHMLRIARDKSRVQNLLPETVETLSLEEGSLVFVNACSSTAPVLTFGKFSSFGWEFYRRGAGVFLGTLGAIPTRYAVSFAETVYEEMLRKDMRQTLGQAVAAAKKKAATERNLFWLLYCIYGDPDFSMQVP